MLKSGASVSMDLPPTEEAGQESYYAPPIEPTLFSPTNWTILAPTTKLSCHVARFYIKDGNSKASDTGRLESHHQAGLRRFQGLKRSALYLTGPIQKLVKTFESV